MKYKVFCIYRRKFILIKQIKLDVLMHFIENVLKISLEDNSMII